MKAGRSTAMRATTAKRVGRRRVGFFSRRGFFPHHYSLGLGGSGEQWCVGILGVAANDVRWRFGGDGERCDFGVLGAWARTQWRVVGGSSFLINY